ncbi:MAG: alkylhalidase, partial [Planctomycetales bacterium 12-60-4]
MITQSDSTDVIVVGGGPAGATTATLTAQRGYSVTLFERERFPRYHVGESLIPETFWVLERLKMIEKLRKSKFVQKHSVQSITDRPVLSEPFYFADNKPHESSQTWQILRCEFDQMMLENAAEQGVTVHEGMRVLDVLFDGSRAVGVRVQDEEGNQSEVHARVVVDAAGQSNLLMDRLRLREWDPELKKAAIWT